MAYIDSFNINETNYDAAFLRNAGVNNVTSLANLPVDKRMIYATLSNTSTLSIQDGMDVGEGLVVICKCTAEFELQFNSDSKYKFIGNNGSIFCQNNTIFKIYITKSSDSSYVINLGLINGEMPRQFAIHISKTVMDSESIITVSGINPEHLLSKFRRCMCKKVSDGKVKICYLNDENSNQYHDGTTANTTGPEGDVMVYFPEFWYLGTDNDFEHIMNISMVEKEGYKHAAASLVGAYKANSTSGSNNNDTGTLHSISNADKTVNVSMSNFGKQVKKRGTGYHLIDYQQHCIITWMFYARYKTTDSDATCGYGTSASTSASIKTGSTNSLGIRDTKRSEQPTSVNFLGLESCWDGLLEYMEGIHSYYDSSNKTNCGIIAYDKGDYRDKTYEYVYGYNKNARILRQAYPTPFKNAGYIQQIIGGSNMDMFPTVAMDALSDTSTRFGGYVDVDPTFTYIATRGSSDNGDPFSNRVIGISLQYASHVAGNMGSTRIAFDGDIEVVEDVNIFKALPVL